MTDSAATHAGKVYLVGAGPGDPGLITWRGVECLRRADVVLYDYLVNPRILAHAAPGAELISLGQHGRDRIMPQAEINQRLVEQARKGRTVVRLKGGDPGIFGRLSDEMEALAAAGIPFEIVPGITAALAAGSYAGLSITHRAGASAVALVTGHEQDEKKASAGLDFSALAAFPGTLVFYMGVTTAGDWTAALIAGGRSTNTPAIIIRRCSWPDQQTIHTTLSRVPGELAAAHMRPPVIVIVGEVAAATAAHDWFAARPLFGLRVLLTRPLEQTDALWNRLTELGAECLVQPAIRISPPADWAPLDAALATLDRFDWIVFSSANGVRYFMDRLLANADPRRLGRTRLAVIGPGTADELARYRLKADLCPDEYRAEALAARLAAEAAGGRMLLIRASRGREVLAEQLTAAGATVEQVVVYSSTDVEQPDPDIAAALSAGRIDWITVTSSAIARSLVKMFGSSLSQTKLASISPITTATLRELGHEPAAEATEYTMNGIVQAIRRNGEWGMGSGE